MDIQFGGDIASVSGDGMNGEKKMGSDFLI